MTRSFPKITLKKTSQISSTHVLSVRPVNLIDRLPMRGPPPRIQTRGGESMGGKELRPAQRIFRPTKHKNKLTWNSHNKYHILGVGAHDSWLPTVWVFLMLKKLYSPHNIHHWHTHTHICGFYVESDAKKKRSPSRPSHIKATWIGKRSCPSICEHGTLDADIIGVQSQPEARFFAEKKVWW